MVRLHHASRTVALSFVFVSLAAAAPAQTNFWTGGDSYWDLAANWSLGSPMTGQNVLIGTSPYGFAGGTTFRTGSLSIGTLDSRNALTITGGSLEIGSRTSLSRVDGALTLSGGSLGGEADLAVGGLLTLTGGTLAGGGRTIANGGIAIRGPVRIAGTRTLENKGNLAWTSGNVTVESGARLQNATGATFSANAAGTWFGGSLDNAGTLSHTAGSTTFSEVAITNSGTVESSAGDLRFLNPTSFTNASGTVRATGNGRILFQGGTYAVNTMGLTASGNGRISFSGATLVGDAAAPWAIPSTVTAGAISLAGSTLRNVVLRNSDLLGLFGSNTLENVSADRGLRFAGGVQTISGTFDPNGPIALNSGARLGLAGNRTIDYAIDAGDTNSGILAAAGSVITLSSGVRWTGVGGKIDAEGSAFDFRNEGRIGATSALVVDVAGGRLTNAGTIENSGYASRLSVGNGSFDNSATIDVDGGVLEILGAAGASFQNTGTLEARNGGRIGVLNNFAAGSVRWTNSGILRADGEGSRLALGGTFTLAGLGDYALTNGATASIHGTLDNTGRTFSVGSTRPWILTDNGRILGGRLLGSNNLRFERAFGTISLENVELDGGLDVGNARVLLAGTTRLNGETTGQGGRIDFSQDVTLNHDVTGVSFGMAKNDGTITVATGTTVAGGLGVNSSFPQVSNVNVVNRGTLRGTGSGYMQATITNEGLLEQNVGTLTIYNRGDLVNQGDVRAQGGIIYLGGDGRVRNSGTMTATGGGTLWFDSFASSQPLVNEGAIRAEGVGSSLRFDFDKAFTLASLGNVGATDGAYLSVAGSGKLDLQGGSLTLDSGPRGNWRLEGGGTIFGGKIVNSERLGLNNKANRQTLRDVSVDHGLNVEEGVVSLEGDFRSGGAVVARGTGQIYTRLNRAVDYAIRFTGAAGENGTIALGTTNFGDRAIVASDGEISGRNLTLSVESNTLDLTNRGRIVARGPGGRMEIVGSVQNDGVMRATDSGTLLVGTYGTLLNQNGTTLSGGVFQADAGGRIQIRGLDVRQNDASIILDGVGSRLEDAAGNDALRNLAVNSGALSLSGGRSMALGQSLRNSGALGLASGSTLSLRGGLTQTATGRLNLGLDSTGIGLLAVDGNVSLAGGLGVELLDGYAPVVGTRYTFLTYTGRLDGMLDVDATRWSVVYGPGAVSLQAVPEPASLLALGTGALAFVRSRRKRA